MELENIKFKAKVLNSGEWVEGDFLHRITDTCIAIKDMDDVVYYPVDPSTVCQFTGRYAEDYTPIYESDVIECIYFDAQDNDTHVTGTIAWEEDIWGFVLKDYMFEDLSVGNRYRGEEYIILPGTDDTESIIKVIGNKFDKEK